MQLEILGPKWESLRLCSGLCLAGYYCPGNIVNTLPTGGQDSNNELKVVEGRYGSPGASTNQGHAQCPAGFLCPIGTADEICGSSSLDNCRKRCGFDKPAGQYESVYCPGGSGANPLLYQLKIQLRVATRPALTAIKGHAKVCPAMYYCEEV